MYEKESNTSLEDSHMKRLFVFIVTVNFMLTTVLALTEIEKQTLMEKYMSGQVSASDLLKLQAGENPSTATTPVNSNEPADEKDRNKNPGEDKKNKGEFYSSYYKKYRVAYL